MQINFLDTKGTITFDEINKLTAFVGWGDCYYHTKQIWQQVLKKSSYVAYAKDHNGLICFGRILEDGIMCMFYDICVHPNYQRQGVGNALMKHLINKIKDKNYVSIGLFTWEGNKSADKFYKSLGFKSVNAMELKKYMRDLN